ncbi:MAG: hypothetical protein NTV40_09545 [Solirubrobacterales bacterium]|nr:hypothetical protein [Solirubrobacterales bacterium]
MPPTDPPDPTLEDNPDPAQAQYESSEELIAMRKQERELEATEVGLEEKLKSFAADVETTRKAEEAEYSKTHWRQPRETPAPDETGDAGDS